MHSFKCITIFFRNPYDRLLSAYQDKALRDGGQYTKRALRTKHNYNTGPLPFPAFIKAILDGARHGEKDLSSPTAGSNLDGHWAPQVLLCDPCRTNYTMVGFHQHMAADLMASLTEFRMDVAISKQNSNDEVLSENITRIPRSQWYKQLDEESIKGIQELYQEDFKILGLNSEPPLDEDWNES